MPVPAPVAIYLLIIPYGCFHCSQRFATANELFDHLDAIPDINVIYQQRFDGNTRSF